MGSTVNMKSFVVLSALVACGLAAPTADADAQIIAGGLLGHGLVGHGLVGHGLLGHGLVGGVYASGPAVAPVTVAHAAPIVHAAPVAIATAPVVHQVGYQVHHQVHHV